MVKLMGILLAVIGCSAAGLMKASNLKERKRLLPVSYTHLDVYKRQTVATSDGLEQMMIFGQGALRMSARELRQKVLDKMCIRDRRCIMRRNVPMPKFLPLKKTKL